MVSTLDQGGTTRFVHALSCLAADVVLSRRDLFIAEEFRLRKRGKSALKEVRCSLSPM